MSKKLKESQKNVIKPDYMLTLKSLQIKTTNMCNV